MYTPLLVKYKRQSDRGRWLPARRRPPIWNNVKKNCEFILERRVSTRLKNEFRLRFDFFGKASCAHVPVEQWYAVILQKIILKNIQVRVYYNRPINKIILLLHKHYSKTVKTKLILWSLFAMLQICAVINNLFIFIHMENQQCERIK